MSLILFQCSGNMFTEGKPKLHHHPDMEKTAIVSRTPEAMLIALIGGHHAVEHKRQGG
jgi:hypothetical protein